MIVHLALDTTSLSKKKNEKTLFRLFGNAFPLKIIVNNYTKITSNFFDNSKVSCGIFCNGTKGMVDIKDYKRKYNICVKGIYLPNLLERDIDGKKAWSVIIQTIKNFTKEYRQEWGIWNIKRREKKYKINELKIIKIDEPWVYFSLVDQITENFLLAIDVGTDLEYYVKIMKKYHKSFGKRILMSYNYDAARNDLYDSFVKMINQKSDCLPVWQVLTMDIDLIDKNNLRDILQSFIEYCQKTQVDNPLVIIKYKNYIDNINNCKILHNCLCSIL